MPATDAMNELVGRCVRSIAGHDKGALFLVVGEEEGYLLLANGKPRSILHPKRKKLRHVELMREGETIHPTAGKLRRKAAVSDRELKRAIAAFKGEISLGKR